MAASRADYSALQCPNRIEIVLEDGQGPGKERERSLSFATVPALHLEKLDSILLVHDNPAALAHVLCSKLDRRAGRGYSPFGGRPQAAAATALEYLGKRQFQHHDARRVSDAEGVCRWVAPRAKSLSPDLGRGLEGFQVSRVDITKLKAVLGSVKLLTIEVVEKEQRNGDPPSISISQRKPARGTRLGRLRPAVTPG